MKKSIIAGILIALCATISFAKPPKPPTGYRWVINEQFSDEFNGNELDKNKWMNTYNGGWQGRAPAWFNPEAVSVADGKLKIKSGVLDKPKGNYTMYGGAVSSKTKNAHFGYYECKAKASKIAMSTTFWMSNDKVPFTENDDCKTDSYSQELDIQEAVGGSTTYDKFKNGMNCNTHYRYVKCGERKETFISKGAGTKLKSPVYADYHIYGAWWKDAEEVTFYANDELFDTVEFRKDISKKPFNRPMQINLVTETYDWQPAPSAKDLENPKINTAYYDWVRSYMLVPIDKKMKDRYNADVFGTEITVDADFKGETLQISYQYECNEDCEIELSILDKEGKKLKTIKVSALKGYGFNTQGLKHLKKDIKNQKGLRIEAKLQSINSSRIDIRVENQI